MSSTPVKKGRGVLMELPNGHDQSPAAKGPRKAEDASDATPEGEKKKSPFLVRVKPSNKPPLYASPAVHRRSSLAANNSKRIRQSPHMKRVSFGGDTINIIEQHRYEFKSPNAISPTESSASPPHKARKLSHPSSPAVRRSPALVKKSHSLIGEDDADDDTVTLPEAPRLFASSVDGGPPRPRIEARAKHPNALSLTNAFDSLLTADGDDDTLTLPDAPRLSAHSMDRQQPPSPMEARSTPVPVRRSSMAQARQSFGIFLDDEVTMGQRDVNLTDEHDVPFAQNSMLANHDSSRDDDSDSDVTKDLGNITGVFSHLLDTDESAPMDLHQGGELQRNLPPAISVPRPRLSSVSSRKSLGYIGNFNLLDETTGDELDTRRGRCSMAPMMGNQPLDREIDAMPRRFSVHNPAMQIGDILQQVEDDEREDTENLQQAKDSDENVQATPSPNPNSSDNVSVPVAAESSERVPKRPNLPESGGSVQAMPVDPGASGKVQTSSLDPASGGHVQAMPVVPENSNNVQEIHPTNAGTVQPRLVLPDNRKLFDVDVTEETLHFHEVVAVPLKPTVPESKPISENREQHTLSEQDADRAPVQPRARPEMAPSDAPDIAEQQPANEPDGDHVEAELKNHVAPQSNIAIVTPRSAAGARIRAAAAEKGAPCSATKLSTPLSAPGSKIRASFRERTISGRREGADSHVQHLSNSVLMASVSKAAPQQASLFNIADFLGASNVRFDDNILSENRDPSIAPDVNSVETDRSSVEWRMIQSVKKEKILTRIEEELAKQQELLSTTKQSIASLERDILTSNPPVFSLMSKSDSLAGKEVTNCRVGLKRLRKVSHFQNRLDWVLSRQKWERAICDDLQTTASACQKDIKALHHSRQALVARHDSLKETLNSCNVNWERGDMEGVGAVDMRRKEVVDEFAYIQELRNLTLSKRTAEREHLTKKEELVPKKAQLVALLKNLQSYAGAQADNKLKAKVTERMERNMLVCGMAGLRPMHVSGKGIVATLVELMEVDLKLSGDRVHTASIRAMVIPGNPSSFIQSFVQGAVSLTGVHMKKLESVRQIPFALHSSAERLLYARNFLEETVDYFDSHLGEMSAANVSDEEFPSLDVTLVASFYSLTAWTKFDITVTISTFFPEPPAGTSHQKVKDFSLQRFIGVSPPAEHVRETFEKSGFRKNLQKFSVRDAFSSVWGLL